MYLRTLLYALLQGVALGPHERASTPPAKICASASGVGEPTGASSGALVKYDYSAESVRVPDKLLDLYLSSQDSTSLTSKVLDVYAAYVDEGEVSLVAVRLRVVAGIHALENALKRSLYIYPSTALATGMYGVCRHPSSDARQRWNTAI